MQKSKRQFLALENTPPSTGRRRGTEARPKCEESVTVCRASLEVKGGGGMKEGFLEEVMGVQGHRYPGGEGKGDDQTETIIYQGKERQELLPSS